MKHTLLLIAVFVLVSCTSNPTGSTPQNRKIMELSADIEWMSPDGELVQKWDDVWIGRSRVIVDEHGNPLITDGISNLRTLEFSDNGHPVVITGGLIKITDIKNYEL